MAKQLPEIGDALDRSMIAAALRNVEVAALIGTAESTIDHWRRKIKEPRGKHFLALLRNVPGFAELLGLKVIKVTR